MLEEMLKIDRGVSFVCGGPRGLRGDDGMGSRAGLPTRYELLEQSKTFGYSTLEDGG